MEDTPVAQGAIRVETPPRNRELQGAEREAAQQGQREALPRVTRFAAPRPAGEQELSAESTGTRGSFLEQNGVLHRDDS